MLMYPSCIASRLQFTAGNGYLRLGLGYRCYVMFVNQTVHELVIVL